MTADRLNSRNLLRNAVLFGAAIILLIAANIAMSCGAFYESRAVYLLFAANAALNLAILFDICTDIRRNFPLLVFVLSYDLLLLGRVYAAFLTDFDNILYDLQADSFENLFQSLQIVTLSLLFVYAAYRLSAPLFFRREKEVYKKGTGAVRSNQLLPVIRQLSEIALLISSVAFFYVLFHSVLYVVRHGYLTSYTQQADSIPSAVSRLSMFFIPSFAVFLATLPSRKQMRLPMLIYGVYMVLSLFTGRRNTFVCEALMLLIYFILRDGLRAKEKRVVKGKTVAWGILAAVVLGYALEVVAETRSSGHLHFRSLPSAIYTFIYSQGATFRVISETVNCWDRFDHNSTYLYLFYPFELFAHNNTFLHAAFGFTPIVETQSMPFVMTTHNYAHVLTFMVAPDRYLSGGGFGTSYVAEAYVAYGMGGVAAVSAIVGVVFRFFSSMLTRPWYILAPTLLAVKDFVFIPRNFAFSWVFDVFNLTYLCFFLVIYFLALVIVSFGAHLRKVPGFREEHLQSGAGT